MNGKYVPITVPAPGFAGSTIVMKGASRVSEKTD